MKKLIKILLDSKLAKINEIHGCTDEEVSFIETKHNVFLPNSYRDFLLHIGKGAGKFMQGTDIFYPSINDIKRESIELLKENGEEFSLADSDFVFEMHQGYEFLYFKLSNTDNNDSSVYQYVEGEGGITKEWDSFEDYIDDVLAQEMTR